MFKENKEFWLFFLGIIIMFFLIYLLMRGGFSNSGFLPSGFPFNLLGSNTALFPQSNFKIDTTKTYQAVISTNKGDITIELYAQSAPNTVSNFIYLANTHFYDDLPFSRLVKGLLLQGGSPTATNTDPNDDKFGGPGYTIPDEINWDSLDYAAALKAQLSSAGYKSTTLLKSVDIGKYAVAMASNGPNTGGSQFMIILGENNDPRVLALRGEHTVFGHVIGGFAVLDGTNDLTLSSSTSGDPIPLHFWINTVTIQVKQ